MKVTLCFALVLLIVAVNAYHLEKEIPRQNNNGIERIVNGEDTEIKSYFVKISAYSRNGTRKEGSGSLITRRHVLTLGSLIKGFSTWHIGYGSKVLSKLTNITSSFGFIHPLFEDFDNSNDIGIIILPNELTTDSVAPISLPDVITPLPRDFEEGTIVGFETTSFSIGLASDAPLKSAYLSVIPSKDCTSLVDSFCAADSYYDANVCASDIGTGFTVHYRGNVLLAGMLTAANHWCEKGDRSFYLRVQSYVPWIKAVTNM